MKPLQAKKTAQGMQDSSLSTCRARPVFIAALPGSENPPRTNASGFPLIPFSA
jgi:hypothetical protein